MTEAIAILVGILIGIILVLIVHSMYQKLNAKLTGYIERQNKANKKLLQDVMTDYTKLEERVSDIENCLTDL